jgi:hypothetical protein
MRNNFYLLLLLLTASGIIHAQDCHGLKDNEVVRLDKDNGPLVNGRIQDQDGIGTCYANASSVALQTALPGNPDVSYLQLAFAHAQIEVAPTNTDRDSAYVYNNGQKGDQLINGGQVCKTIEAAKNDKIGGVCKRDDVALEKSIFDSKSNASKDTSAVQNQLINAVSNYYDSIKEKFGIKPGAAKSEIAARTAAYSNFQNAFNNLVQARKDQWSQKNCLKPDTTNVETVFKNMQLRVYTFLKNKYGDSSKFSNAYQRVNGKPNPDASLYLYYLGMGGVNSSSANSELKVDVAFKYADNFKNSYMGDLNSKTPPKDAVVAFKNALLKADSKNGPLIDKLLGEMSPEDKSTLEKDYNRFVKKDVSDCVQKNALAYYKSDDGLIKDFEQDVCLKNYLAQGKNLQSMAAILDRQNLNNIDSLNAFLMKLPSMNYQQAMSAIIAPDCTDAKKIKIPQNLRCETNDFNYVWDLRLDLVSSGVRTWEQIEKEIKDEEEKIKKQIDDGYPAQVAALEARYAGKDSTEMSKKATELTNLEIEKNNRKLHAHEAASAIVPKRLAGANEPRFWDKYIKDKKSKLNTDAVSLLKNNKQAIPVTLCTRMFTEPSATALRDGECEKSSADSTYQSVGGYHAMAMIGMRCQKGKLNYLIQNSWGDWDSIKTTKNADGTQHFEHEFGKAWMDEDEFINNSYGYQSITK